MSLGCVCVCVCVVGSGINYLATISPAERSKEGV